MSTSPRFTKDSARSALRAATSGDHDRVDALFSRVDFADRDDYARFLMAQASAHIPVEAALGAGGIADVVPDWPARRRAGLLRADLADLGQAPPDGARPVFAGVPALLGAAYVLEGSRLGGAMLKRSVAADLPTRFLGGGDSAAWRGLLALLDEHLADESDRQTAIKAAVGVFVLFEHGGRRFLKAE